MLQNILAKLKKSQTKTYSDSDKRAQEWAALESAYLQTQNQNASYQTLINQANHQITATANQINAQNAYYQIRGKSRTSYPYLENNHYYYPPTESELKQTYAQAKEQKLRLENPGLQQLYNEVEEAKKKYAAFLALCQE